MIKVTEIVFASSMVLFLSLRLFLDFFDCTFCFRNSISSPVCGWGGNWMVALASLWQVETMLQEEERGAVSSRSPARMGRESMLNSHSRKLVRH